jgi:hypothetical protein
MERYPYYLPIFRRSHKAISPDGRHRAVIDKAFEMGMSNPTIGQLKVDGELTLDNCSPVFLWSDDSRYLALAQWIFRWLFRSRERLIILDMREKQAYLSRPQYTNIIIKSFDGDTIELIDSPTWKSQKMTISLTEASNSFERLELEKLKKV